MNMDLINKWISRKGKFCVVDYKTPNGVKTAVGELIEVISDKLILKNLDNGEEYEVSIENIENSRVRDKREVNDGPH